MPQIEVEPTAVAETDVDDRPEPKPSCAACGHELAAHDPIGLRYCSATTAGGFDRGCVCVGTT